MAELIRLIPYYFYPIIFTYVSCLSKYKLEKDIFQLRRPCFSFRKLLFIKKKNLKRLSFITQFKIEFLLPFTGNRKVLEKMPVWCILNVT